MAISQPTPSEVRTVIKTAITDEQIQQFIDDAVLMTENCDIIATYSEAKQKAIVRWLAAHLIATQAPAMKSQGIGDASESYESPITGEGLKGSRYGQQAILLDPSGCLAKQGKVKSTFEVL